MLVIFVAAMTTRFPLLAPLVHAGNDIGLRHFSNDKSITINRIHDVTTVTTLHRITGKATVETFIGDSPYGK